MRTLFALLVVAALCGAANAGSVWLDATTPIGVPGQEFTFTVSGSQLLAIDVLFAVSGDLTISGYMSNLDSASYGWDPVGFPIDPVVGASSVEIGAANFNGNKVAAPGVVGYVKVLWGGGHGVLTMNPGYVFGGSYDSLGSPANVISGQIVIPEPMTLALLGIGGLFIRRRR